MTVAEAVGRIPAGARIFIGSGAAEPVGFVQELVAQADRFSDNPILHILTMGPAPYVEAAYQDSFRHAAFFIGANVREAVRDGRADYMPVFLSRIPELIRSRRTGVDVALVQVTPPDRHGYVNLGVSVDIVLAAVQSAKLVFAEINPHMPTVYGEGYVSMDDIDGWFERPSDLPTLPRVPADAVAREIGQQVATLVEDGSTVQVGIGQIPDAVLEQLRDRSDLGVWTELLTDGLVDLIRAGNVTGRFKTMEPRVASATFAMGSAQTYRWLDHNPAVVFHPSDVVNDPRNIARQHKMVAINAALQIDLTGQVCADSIGTKFYSGIGGQVDFIRGASMAPGGKPIVAVRSTARQGQVSRIVAVLDEGAGVVTSRGDVQYVVTEYGVADLLGRSVRQRALALISIAHPDHRAELLAQAKRRRYVFADQRRPRLIDPRLRDTTFATERGELRIRALRETDDDDVQALLYALATRTEYDRWMAATGQTERRELARFLEVDDMGHVALVVEAPTHSGSEVVGAARYSQAPATGLADVAVVVREGWRRLGIGTALLERLAELAERNGIVGFTAQVPAAETGLLHVFRKVRRCATAALDGASLSLQMSLRAEPAPQP